MSMSMTTWTLLPRDGALFRDARPFTGTAGAVSLPMPWPSTLAGFVRSRIGMSPSGDFELTHEEARQIAIQGPWLCELAPDDTVASHFFPAPADAVFFPATPRQPGMLVRRRLSLLGPTADQDVLSDLPEGLQLVGFPEVAAADPGKPATGPAFWHAEALAAWLAAPSEEELVKAQALGIPALAEDERIHVAIEAESRTAAEGKLFATIQRHFVHTDNGRIRQFGLVCQTATTRHVERMGHGPGTLGGERRLSLVRKAPATAPLPLPATLDGRRLRIVLLTPAIFKHGYAPIMELKGKARVIGACVPRFHAVSGWSFEERGPKPTRYMAPAGSVYWLEFDTDASALTWAHETHFTCLAADAQDARDGFGLLAVGNA